MQCMHVCTCKFSSQFPTTLWTRHLGPDSGQDQDVSCPSSCPSFTPPLVNSLLPATKNDWAFSPPLAMTRRKSAVVPVVPSSVWISNLCGRWAPGKRVDDEGGGVGGPARVDMEKRWPDQDECSGTTIHHACTMRRERQGRRGRQGGVPPCKVHQARRTLISLLQLGKFGHSLSRGKRQAAGKDSRRRFDNRAHGRSRPGVRQTLRPFW